MKKIIDVGPPPQSQRGIATWVRQTARLLPDGLGTRREILGGIADRIDAAPEVTDTTVLIDTADIDLIKRLVERITSHGGIHYDDRQDTAVWRVRQALADLTKPPVEEPTLFGAIVRDPDNKDWVRTLGPMAPRGQKCWARGGAFLEFDVIDAQEVVFPGIDQTVDQAI